jgi:hypothetical protein
LFCSGEREWAVEAVCGPGSTERKEGREDGESVYSSAVLGKLDQIMVLRGLEEKVKESQMFGVLLVFDVGTGVQMGNQGRDLIR